ncbi:MAG: putative lipid II flippase FtsW [Proteobacteria bacterium]|nr:putative lipid II flippase FtsW [Pseudomonadota bacterium]
MERIDKYLLIPFLFLILIGCIMVFSASVSIQSSNTGMVSLFIKHLITIGIGSFFLLVCYFLPLEYWQKIIYYLLIIIVICLVLVLIPGVSNEIKGAKRWLKFPFGFSFQPSFFCKWLLIIYMATSLSKKTPEKIKSFKKGMLPYLIILFVLGLLFLFEPDFGGFAVMVLISFVMMLLAGTRLIYWIAMGAIISPFFVYMVMTKTYRLQRLLAFVDVWKYAQSYSYQIVQSLLSFAAGGITGKGPGNGTQKLMFLPEAHTDFIFSVIGEELGFLGTLSVVIAFIVITVRGFYIAYKLSDNSYLCFLASGLTIFISLEAVFNMLVALSMAPPKGLPLPFISYGGTAMLVYLSSMGMLLNLSRRVKC